MTDVLYVLVGLAIIGGIYPALSAIGYWTAKWADLYGDDPWYHLIHMFIGIITIVGLAIVGFLAYLLGEWLIGGRS